MPEAFGAVHQRQARGVCFDPLTEAEQEKLVGNVNSTMSDCWDKLPEIMEADVETLERLQLKVEGEEERGRR